MSVLVTGGAGYIGSHALVQLIEKGYEVVVVDNLMNSSRVALHRVKNLTGRDFPFYEVDLCDKEGLETIFTNHDIDSVIHFAGLKAVGESVEKPLVYYDNNLTGTLNLLELMVEKGVKKLVFSSSATVYGDPQSVPINEEAPLGATNPYGRTKWMIEMILKDISDSDSDWAIGVLRYFNPVGAHASGRIGEDPKGIPNNLVPFIAGVASGKLNRLKVFGDDYDTPDGTGVRDYIHVEDLVRGHLLILEQLETKKGLQICNLGTGEGYSVFDMVRSFEEVSSRPIPYEIGPKRLGDIASCYADTSLAWQTLGFKAEKGIKDMLKDTWKWQMNNPAGYEEPSLVVMAAGMGSRYGGIKQMEPVGPSGEFILDYALYDAMKAGFRKVVFVIRDDIRQTFREMVEKRWGKKMDLAYVVQSLDDLPTGCQLPEGRQKPWGTGQAVLACREVVKGPFAVINADDFYGRKTFEELYGFLAGCDRRQERLFGMVGFEVASTVTDYGSVSRGVCRVTDEGMLEDIIEYSQIVKEEDGIYYVTSSGKGILDGKTIVSMNTWAFTPDFFNDLNVDFEAFLKSMDNPIKDEFYLPEVVGKLVRSQKARVMVMETTERWYGITYSEDREHIVKGILDMVEAGLYPSDVREDSFER